MGGALSKPVLVQSVERCGNLFYRCGCSTVNGLRGSNEDTHLLHISKSGNECFFGVFDGHSGLEAAVAARDSFERHLRTDYALETSLQSHDKKQLDAKKMICELAAKVDTEVLTECGEDSASGTTGTFFFARCDDSDQSDSSGFDIKLFVGNVGDSRVLLWTGSELQVMTKDHKPDDPEEKARIERFGGKVERGRVEGNLAVSRAFGDAFFKTNKSRNAGPSDQKVIAVPDVTMASVKWGSGAFAVLGCDGVFEGEFSNEYVVEFVRTQLKVTNDLATVAGNVCLEAVRRGSRDNVTCMIVQFADGSEDPGVSTVPSADAFPGPFSLPRHSLFRKLYEEGARAGNRRVEELLEARYDELMAKALAPKKRSRGIDESQQQQRQLTTADENPVVDQEEDDTLLTQDEEKELRQGFWIRKFLRREQFQQPPDEHGHQPAFEEFFDDDDFDSPPVERGPIRTEWFKNLFNFLKTIRSEDDEPPAHAAKAKAKAAAHVVVPAATSTPDALEDEASLSPTQREILASFLSVLPDLTKERARKLLEDCHWDSSAAFDAHYA
jgi:protein phosphatase